jgi:hypothetical protein
MVIFFISGSGGVLTVDVPEFVCGSTIPVASFSWMSGARVTPI